MNEEPKLIKENKKVIFYTIAGIIALAIVALGLTYAYWILTRQQEGVNTVNTACLSLNITNEEDEIDLPSAYPISDEDGLKLVPFKFTIENKCPKNAKYSLNLEMLEDTTLSSEYVKMALNVVGETPYPFSLDNYEEYDEMKISGTKEGRYILSDELASNESKNYELRLWLSSEVTPESDANNKLFKSKIVLDGKIESTSLREKQVCFKDPESNKCILVKNDNETNSLVYDTTSDKNLRYTGISPNNYVRFNNEIWRIIGFIKVKDENNDKVERLKIVRQDGIEGQQDFGKYSFDNNPYSDGIHNYKGTGDWTKSQLKDMLNGIYYNSEIGNCYKGSDVPETCDFSSDGSSFPPGLNQEARNMIDKDVIWNVGDGSTNTSYFSYLSERGTSLFTSTWTKANDSSYHNGVGLIYPSDYGYSVGGDVATKCINNKQLTKYNEDGCSDNSWLKPQNYAIWTMSSSNGSGCYNEGYCGWNHYYVSNYGNVSYMDYTYFTSGIWPSVYLNENVKIVSDESHNGSLQQPYDLTIN